MATAIVFAAAVLVGACGSDAHEALPRSRVRELDLNAGAPGKSEIPVPLGTGSLAAGRYRTTAFAVTLTFTLEEGWSNQGEEAGSVLLEALGGTLAFVALDRVRVLEPPTLGPGPESFASELARSRPAPTDFLGYLLSIRELGAREVAPITILGRAARTVLYTVPLYPGGVEGRCEAQDVCFSPLVTESKPFAQFPGDPSRNTVLDVEGTRLLIAVDASDAASAATFFARADAIVATLQVGRTR